MRLKPKKFDWLRRAAWRAVRGASFSWRISVDGRPNRRNKVAFSYFFSIVWMLPEKTDSKNSHLTRINPTVKSKQTAHVRSWRDSSTVSMRWVACWIYNINRMLEMLLPVHCDLLEFNWKLVKHGAEGLWRDSLARQSNAASNLPRTHELSISPF